jgi:hypothetical protein
VEQGERTCDREALTTKAKRRRSGGCARKAMTLTWGYLALRLKGRRRGAEREVSRGRSSRAEAGKDASWKAGRFSGAKGQTEGRAKRL